VEPDVPAVAEADEVEADEVEADEVEAALVFAAESVLGVPVELALSELQAAITALAPTPIAPTAPTLRMLRRDKSCSVMTNPIVFGTDGTSLRRPMVITPPDSCVFTRESAAKGSVASRATPLRRDVQFW
jgi:hypothetical protein